MLVKKLQGIILILGAPNDDSGNLSLMAKERCDHAIKLLLEHKEYKITLTGGYGEHFNKTSKPHTFYVKNYLISNGIDVEDIIEEIETSNTFEDASLAKEVIKKYNPQDVIVVTSDFHKKRAEFIFRKIYGDTYVVKFSTSKTNLPINEIQKLKNHEKESLTRIKNYFENGKYY